MLDRLAPDDSAGAGFGGLNIEVNFAALPFTPSYYVADEDTGADAVSVRYFVRLTVRTGWTDVRAQCCCAVRVCGRYSPRTGCCVQEEKFWNSHEIALYRAQFTDFNTHQTHDHV